MTVSHIGKVPINIDERRPSEYYLAVFGRMSRERYWKGTDEKYSSIHRRKVQMPGSGPAKRREDTKG